jgi:hypothetical protein
MAETTSGYPYPLPTDPVAEGAAAIQALAEKVDALLAGPRRSIFNAADQSSLLNAASSNIAGFTFPTVAGANYAMEMILFLTCASNTVRLRSGWSWTGTGIINSGQSGLDVNVSAPAYNGTQTAHGYYTVPTSPLISGTGVGVPALPAGQTTVAKVYASFRCSVAGVMQARFRQDNADATYPVVIRAGSWMTYERA